MTGKAGPVLLSWSLAARWRCDDADGDDMISLMEICVRERAETVSDGVIIVDATRLGDGPLYPSRPMDLGLVFGERRGDILGCLVVVVVAFPRVGGNVSVVA